MAHTPAQPAPLGRFRAAPASREADTRVVLDALSKQIIEQLQQDGRRSYAAIGKAVGLSEAAVRQRVQRLGVAWRGGGGGLSARHPNAFWRLAAGEPRIVPLVQFCQIRQAIYRQLLSIALASRRKAFDISADFLS